MQFLLVLTQLFYLYDVLRIVQSQTFSSNNPSFSNKTLTKSFKLADSLPDSTAEEIKSARAYDLEYPLKTSSVNIEWTSAEHNLVSARSHS